MTAVPGGVPHESGRQQAPDARRRRDRPDVRGHRAATSGSPPIGPSPAATCSRRRPGTPSSRTSTTTASSTCSCPRATSRRTRLRHARSEQPVARPGGPQGRVLAVEPNRALHARISRHVRLNRLSNVELVPVALGSSEGEAILTVPAGGSALGTLREDNDASPSTRRKVPVRRLDDVLPKHDRRRLSAIKVDVEGWELEVFLGARDTLAEGKPVLLYECGAEQFEQRHGQFNTPSMTFIEELGYKNHTISMDRHGRWRLRGIESGHDPREDREPWSVLMTVAIHPDSHHDVKMAGQSQLRRCGVFEMLAPGP